MLPSAKVTRRVALVGLAAASLTVAVGQLPTLGPAEAQGQVTLNGAGATFPAPLYQRWSAEFTKKNPGTRINYQSVGSGAGIRQFIAGTVDFGASDAFMSADQIKQVSSGVLQLPVAAGSVVVAYNLPEFPNIRLSRRALAGIFDGTVTRWNHPLIKGANPKLNLPNTPITMIHRSDGSGTTKVFTAHLSAISPDWKAKVGSGTTVQWPSGVGAKGNEGVSAALKKTPGAVGYTEFGYARSQKLQTAFLQNKAGQYVQATAASGAAALNSIDLGPDLTGSDPDPAGNTSYPIVTYTWILAYRNMPDANKAKSLRSFLNWGATQGQSFSDDLGYIPLPASVAKKIQAAVNNIKP